MVLLFTGDEMEACPLKWTEENELIIVGELVRKSLYAPMDIGGVFNLIITYDFMRIDACERCGHAEQLCRVTISEPRLSYQIEVSINIGNSFFLSLFLWF